MNTVNLNSHKEDIRIDVIEAEYFSISVPEFQFFQLAFCSAQGVTTFLYTCFSPVCCLHRACGFRSPLVPPFTLWLPLSLSSVLSTPLPSSLPLLHPGPRLTPKPDQLASDASLQEPWEARLPPLFLLLSAGREQGCRGAGEKDPRWPGHAWCDRARPGAAWTSLYCQSWLQKVLKIIPVYNPWPTKTKQNEKNENKQTLYLSRPKIKKKCFGNSELQFVP